MADFLYVYEPIEWLINNPDTDIKLKVLYFSLEMSKEAKIRAAMSYKLFKDHGIVVSPQRLMSVFNDYILDDNIQAIIESEEFQDFFNKFEEVVEFHDDIRNPYGIYNVVRTYAEANGEYSYKDIEWKDGDKVTKKRVIDSYTPNDPNTFVIVLLDHISLLSPEKGGNLQQAITQFSSEYCLRMRDLWGFSPVVVQQQSAANEQQQFTYKGDSIVEKIKPSPDGLGDSKLSGRDCDLMLGLFWPARYEIPDYKGWDLTKVGKNHRELSILLNRNGISAANVQLYFQGASNFFTELPREPNELIYKKISDWEKNII